MHGLEAGPRRFPRSLADHLMKEEPDYAPAASTATPPHFTVASPAGAERPTRKFPARKKRRRRTAPGPDPSGSSRCPLRRRKRRFLAYSSSSHSPDPPHLTVLTRPGFVRAACHPLRHLPDQAALSFDRLAATRRRRRSLTSTRSASASRRTRPRGHRAAASHLCPGRHRARHPPGAPVRHHPQPRRRLDDASGAQPPDGPRATPDLGQVPDQGSCRPVHQLLRRRVPGGGHQGSRQPTAGAESETSGCILHLFGAIGG